MTAPTLPVLGGATVNRKWIWEIDTANNPLSPNWVVLGGLTNSQFQPDQANMVGDTDQAGQGSQSSTKTGATWGGQVTVKRAPKGNDPTSYDVAQEYCRLKSIGQYGNSNRIRIRVSEYDPNDPNGLYSPRIEAYTGSTTVSWDPQGGDMLAEDTVNIAFQGQGKLSIVSHPYPVTLPVPTITSLNPTTTAVAGGDLIHIYGAYFTSTVAGGVKFGGTAATKFSVESDSLIIAIAPAKTAGPQPVTVQNSAGTSTGTNITYA